ncbi:glycosyltransferase family 2 protein [Klebsiella michiganensis]|uniref:glycosyltransferase family 2 protein n=1 Tax=Klebsiella michiganensis TaxID=1134687 RepID=UPI0012B7B901|nr:hypothetical protein [Klebsiella michiganensis]
MKTIIAVILYNTQIDDSETIKQLAVNVCDNCILIIVNNGPKKINKNSAVLDILVREYIGVEIREYIENKPLSWIYNEVLNGFDSDRYVFFDDDSKIDCDFFIKLKLYYNDSIDVQIPVIYEVSDGQRYYPVVDGGVYKGCDGSVISQNNILSIGSGLVIYKSLISKFNKLNLSLFDERFALYGVDFSFFRRIEMVKRKYSIKIQNVSFIEHSLSRVNTHYSIYRYRERLYDAVLTTRFYSKNKTSSFFNLARIMIKELIKFKVRNIFLIVKVYVIGKHSRC